MTYSDEQLKEAAQRAVKLSIAVDNALVEAYGVGRIIAPEIYSAIILTATFELSLMINTPNYT
jgi:hypothetical protein